MKKILPIFCAHQVQRDETSSERQRGQTDEFEQQKVRRQVSHIIKVLLVSNDPLTSQLWADSLSQYGLKTSVTGSAEETLSRWSKERFDLTIIDVGPPQLDGLELSCRLRIKIDRPILLLTYNRYKPYMMKALEVGVDTYIVKPISDRLFIARVQALLRRL